MNFAKRFYLYQKERFPIFGHGILILVFTFSAISVSRISRQASDFIPLLNYLAAYFSALSIFFTLRVSDEHKDHEDDKKYRQYLPVIRGIISLRELRMIAFVFLLSVLCIHLIFFKSLISLLVLVLFYLGLMYKEFFIAKWLKEHQILYVISHMLIIPLVDFYMSSFDWKLSNSSPPDSLFPFFIVSFLNGLLLEIGRKIKIPSQEEHGVNSYSKLWGLKKALLIYSVILIITLSVALYLNYKLHHSAIEYYILSVAFTFCILPVVKMFIFAKENHGKLIEKATGIWTILLYLSLGGIPMLLQIIKH